MVNDSDKGFLNTMCEIINIFFATRSDANLVQIGITVYKWNNVLVVFFGAKGLFVINTSN
jgi:hypothetical protein